MKTVWIDAGHGGKDCGAVNTHLNLYEKDLTLKLALEVKRQLKLHKINVVMTRLSDATMNYIPRYKLENNNNCDLAISLHLNSCATPNTARGCEIWVHSNANSYTMDFARDMLKEICKVQGTIRRGVKKGFPAQPTLNYWCNRLTRSMSMLIELGFINSDIDANLVINNIDEYAQAITRAICNKLNVNYIGLPPTSANPPFKVTAYDVTVTNVSQDGLNILVNKMLEPKTYRYVVHRRKGNIIAYDVEVTNVNQLGLDVLIAYLKQKQYRYDYKER